MSEAISQTFRILRFEVLFTAAELFNLLPVDAEGAWDATGETIAFAILIGRPMFKRDDHIVGDRAPDLMIQQTRGSYSQLFSSTHNSTDSTRFRQHLTIDAAAWEEIGDQTQGNPLTSIESGNLAIAFSETSQENWRKNVEDTEEKMTLPSKFYVSEYSQRIASIPP
jgi:hypothetical protein